MPTRSARALPAAVRAFDAAAPTFDQRFGNWLSVAAQRRAVRRYVAETFPPGSRLLELGAGTGDDALDLLERGYHVTLTDGSPAMVAEAGAKIERLGLAGRAEVRQLVLEELGEYAARRDAGAPLFDGVYSNFAALNCVADLSTIAAPLAALLRPGAACVLVVFGPCCPAESLVQLCRLDPAAAFRRFRRRAVAARIGQQHFTVWYPPPSAIARALAPHFRLRRMRGIGILVPPSAAEPWISRFPRLVRLLEKADRLLAAPGALLGDHVLLHFERTAASET